VYTLPKVRADIETDNDPELRLPNVPIPLPPPANLSRQEDDELGCSVDAPFKSLLDRLDVEAGDIVLKNAKKSFEFSCSEKIHFSELTLNFPTVVTN
jgi:hypothetical protein